MHRFSKLVLAAFIAFVILTGCTSSTERFYLAIDRNDKINVDKTLSSFESRSHQKYLNNGFRKSIANNNLQMADYLLLKGAEINSYESFQKGNSALMIAAENGHHEILKWLLDKGADIDQKTLVYKFKGTSGNYYKGVYSFEIERVYQGINALGKAVKNKHLAIVKTLLQRGAEPNFRLVTRGLEKSLWFLDPSSMNSAIPKANNFKHSVVISKNKRYQRKGDTVKSTFYPRIEIKTALHIAVENDDVEMIRLLLKNGSDPYIKNFDGEKTTDLLVKGDKGDLLTFIEAETNDYIQLIHYADDGNVKAVQNLIAGGVNVNKARSVDGQSALTAAAYEGNKTVVKLLLDNQAEINAQKKNGDTALIAASYKGEKETIELLLAYGADVNMKKKRGVTALHVASINGHANVILPLLLAGADIDVQNNDGITPFYIAAGLGKVDIAKLFIERGADINVSDNFGNTALIFAAQRGDVDMVRFLVENGADLNALRNDGTTALRTALKGKKHVIAGILEKAGASE